MSFRVRFVLVAAVAVLASCTAEPIGTTITSTTIAATTSSINPGSVVVTTTTMAPTTTVADRIAEITAIFEDLERRRLQAILDQDEDAFRAVHSNQQYLEESLVVLDLVKVIDVEAVEVSIDDILLDSDQCLAVLATVDLSAATAGGGATTTEYVLEFGPEGWGFSWVGEGWRCDGPHPLSL
ncbi:MAG: hypothetical protein R2823_00145 [Acidimicrobiia bacterium]